MLLKEQQQVAAQRAEHGTGPGSGGGSGTEGEGEGGEGGGSAGSSGGSSGGAQASGDKASTAQNRAGGERSSGGKDQSTGSSRSSREGGGREARTAPEGTPTGSDDAATHVPADVGDGHDDDVVARQLREAAMSEEDPAIREKLWEEYRRYKRGG